MKSFFRELYEKHGDDVKALGWGSLYSQKVRFEAICNIVDFKKNDSIIDVGSGFCDFYDYLKNQKNIELDYLGTERCETIYKASKEKHQDEIESKDIRFSILNVDYKDPDFLKKINKNFDYVICSGIFCFDNEENNDEEKLCKNVKKLYSFSKKGLVINFLSKETKNPIKKGFKHFDPDYILNFLRHRITNNVILKKDYIHNDFTVFLKRNHREEK